MLQLYVNKKTRIKELKKNNINLKLNLLTHCGTINNKLLN